MTTLGIIGTGLIGGSIGLRARELGWRVIGCDTDAQAAEEAAACGAIDLAVPRAEILEQADTIVIASHTGATIAELEAMRAEPPRAAKLILDIASVKAPVVRAGRGLRNFVATHPMAGRERSGASAATRDLFEGKTWLYVPTGDRELDWCVVEFIGAFGATPVEVDAQEHDGIVAFTSHVPQVFATLFARSAEQRTGIDAYMGPAAREFLRLSRSNPHMWHDIIEANHTNIARELRLLAEQLARTADDIENARNVYEPVSS
jgi:prephenate dehydrogenase